MASLFVLLAAALAAGMGAGGEWPAAPEVRTEAAPGAETPCPGFVHVPGQGPSCPVSGGWQVLLSGGGLLLSHGPDRIPHADSVLGESVGRGGIAPTCVEGADAGPHGALVYARPSDAADAYEELAPALRTLAAEANAVLSAEAAAFGVGASFRMLCDAGVLAVAHVVLPTPAAETTFATIAEDLALQGFDHENAKYWVWYDGAVSCDGCGGQANVWDDDRATSKNRNNRGGVFYAVTYGRNYWPQSLGPRGALTMLHEAVHNLGAVQKSAPHSSGSWHCSDGRDVMCYDDKGPDATQRAVCEGAHVLDCNHDDYFHPAPPPGSYLSGHWNVASRENRWIAWS
ncbi:MAG: hypothetical protein ACT4PT_03295 [Methanobacteriota archaeon]